MLVLIKTISSSAVYIELSIDEKRELNNSFMVDKIVFCEEFKKSYLLKVKLFDKCFY